MKPGAGGARREWRVDETPNSKFQTPEKLQVANDE